MGAPRWLREQVRLPEEWSLESFPLQAPARGVAARDPHPRLNYDAATEAGTAAQQVREQDDRDDALFWEHLVSSP